MALRHAGSNPHVGDVRRRSITKKRELPYRMSRASPVHRPRVFTVTHRLVVRYSFYPLLTNNIPSRKVRKWKQKYLSHSGLNPGNDFKNLLDREGFAQGSLGAEDAGRKSVYHPILSKSFLH